jgi:cell division protein FtsB
MSEYDIEDTPETEAPRKPRRARKRRRQPRRIYSLWARLGFLVFVVGLLCAAAVGLIAKAIRPYQELSVQTKQLKQTESQISDLSKQNDDLQRRIDALQTPSGIATQARTMGYVQKGEIPIVMPGTTPNRWTEKPLPSRGGEDRSLSARWRGWWKRVTSGH